LRAWHRHWHWHSHSLWHTWFSILAVLVFGLGLLPLGGPPPAAAQSGGTLTMGRSGDADSLDPHRTLAAISSQTFGFIYDTLVTRNLEGRFDPGLAQTWEISSDGLIYTFHLRRGVKFHDGTDFDARAVKFTFDRVTNPDVKALPSPHISALASTEAVDDFTVKITLKESFSPFLSNLTISYFGILSPAAVQKYGDDYGKNPVGTGPFMFKEWVPGDRIVLVRNPNYTDPRSYVTNKGAPLLEQLIFRNIPEEQTQVAALESGEINFIQLPPRETRRFSSDPDYNVFRVENSTTIAFLEFAMEPPSGTYGATFKPPFDDLKLRQAVAYAVDADSIINDLLEGLAVRNYGPMPVGNLGYTPDIEQYGYKHNPDRAKALLDEAGWVPGPDGIRVKDGQRLEILMWTWNATTVQRIAEVVQNQLGKVGIGVRIETMEVGTFLARRREGVSNLDYITWSWPEADILYRITTVEGSIGYYRPESYRKIVEEARRVVDPDQRAKLYFEAMKVLLADAAMVPLWSPFTVYATRAEVQGFKLGPQGALVFQDAWVKK